MTADQLYADDLFEGFSFSGREITLTDDMFAAFGAMTGDNHPIHHDKAYAARTPFGRPVAHGLLLCALTAVGATDLSPRLEAAMIAFAGQSAEFLKPAFVGDRLTASYRVIANSTREGSRTARVELAVRLARADGEIVLEGRHAYLLRRRPT